MEFFNIDGRLLETAKKAEEMASEQFAKISETAEYNGNKVLSAFINNRVSEMHLKGTIGYGYNDDGREISLTWYMPRFFARRTHLSVTAL